jgi:hypothetical protein
MRAPVRSTSTRSRTGIIVWSIATLLFFLVATVVAVESALHFSGVPIDGPFQLYDALRRIAAGYRPGIDFQFFHGLGLPFLYYPLFRAFGAGLRGSELARNLVSPVAFAVTALLFFRAFAGTWTRAVYGTATLFALAFTIKLSSAFFALVFAINGMLGVRSSLPILLPAVLYVARTRWQRSLGGGLVLGLALFYGTEQGLAAMLAFLVVSGVAIARRRERWAQVAESAATVAVAAIVLVGALTSVAGWAGMRGALHYNFSIVPADQYWFFGSPPNIFIPTWSAAPGMVLAVWQIALGLALAAVASVLYVRRLARQPESALGARHFALAVLPLYGLISLTSLLGVFTPMYSQPCWRTIVLVAIIEWLRFADSRWDGARGVERLGVPRIAATTTAALIAASFLTVPLVRTSLGGSLVHVVRAHVIGHSRFEAGGVWPGTLATGQALIDSRRGPNGEPPTLWSTYAGWIEARNGLFNPSFDYMIHALGPDNRRRYVQTFRDSKPRLVQTVLPTFTQYEPWLENTNWAFYDELLNWYDVVDTTPWSIYWERRATAAPTPQAIGEMQVPAGMSVVTLPPLPALPTDSASAAMLLEVEIDYTISNPLRWLPVVGNSPRYLVGIDGALSHLPVSLDPFVTTTRFPIVVRRDEHPRLFFTTKSLLPGASFMPRTLRLYVRPLTPGSAAWISNLAERLGR